MTYKIPAQTFDGMTITQELKFGLNIVITQGNTPSNTFRLCAANGTGIREGEIWVDEEIYLMAFYIPGSSTKRVIYATKDTGKSQFYENVMYSNQWFSQSWITATYTYNGKKVYCLEYATMQELALSDGLTYNSVSDVTNYDYLKLAWLMIYGGYTGFEITYDLENCTGDENNPAVIQPDTPITIANFIPDSSDDEIFIFNSGSCWIDGQGAEAGLPVLFSFDPDTGNLRIGLVSTDIVVHVHAFGDPYQGIDGESDIPGGDTIQVPGSPTVTATSSGFIGLFAPTSAQMKLLADYMWTDFGGTGTTEVDVLKEIVQALKRSICNPLDYVIGLSIIPSQGLSIGSNQEIRFGFTNSGISFPRLTSQFFVVDCGSLSFDTLCDDTFLDYAPYSKFSIYLPYIGFRVVDANDFVGHTIGVIYHGDVVTGGLTAFILKDGSVMYQYSGSCSLNVPLRADAWSSTIASAISLARSIPPAPTPGGSTSGGGSAESVPSGNSWSDSANDYLSAIGPVGNPGATGQNGLHAASNLAFNPSLIAPQVMRSGAISGGAGQLGVQKPYVVREAVRFHSTKGMNTLAGYPSYYFMPLSSMHGYTVVEEVHIHGITATAEEISEIESLLKGGVIF